MDFLPNLITAENGGSIGDSWDGNTFTTPERVVPEPVVTPTKEELLAQLQALTAKIEALE